MLNTLLDLNVLVSADLDPRKIPEPTAEAARALLQLVVKTLSKPDSRRELGVLSFSE